MKPASKLTTIRILVSKRWVCKLVWYLTFTLFVEVRNYCCGVCTANWTLNLTFNDHELHAGSYSFLIIYTAKLGVQSIRDGRLYAFKYTMFLHLCRHLKGYLLHHILNVVVVVVLLWNTGERNSKWRGNGDRVWPPYKTNHSHCKKKKNSSEGSRKNY